MTDVMMSWNANREKGTAACLRLPIRFSFVVPRLDLQGGTSDSAGPRLVSSMVGRRGLSAAGPTLLLLSINESASKARVMEM